MDTVLRAAAEQWLAVDPDADTRAELASLLAAGDVAELTDRFGARLRFGTAGLRGALGAGPNRMNRVVVRQAAKALITSLRPGAMVVIGYDARHKSDVFARDTAAVVAGHGGHAVLLPGPLPTPVLAFAVRHLGADAGVMVTASHNPPSDNGYKVYLGDGAQIAAPHDASIEAAIAGGGLPTRDLPPPAPEGLVTNASDDLVSAYLDAVVPDARPDPDLAATKVVYTPLHGVGRDVLLRALVRVGCAPVVVPTQSDPDPNFSTVAFPNPEEQGALDAAVALARHVEADIVIAHDPDADRLAVAVPFGDDWRRLTGDEVGALLAEFVLASTNGDDRLVAATVVSSSLLAKQAAHHGVRYAETLNGFKWVVRPALADPTVRFVFGYEEALGYAVNDVVRDKDAIAAAVAFLRLHAGLRRRGCDVPAALDELAAQYGRHLTAQVSLRLDGNGASARLADRMTALRAEPPAQIGGRTVVGVHDYLDGGAAMAPSDILRIDLDDGERVMLRPSGTEPKLKVYVEVVADADDLDAPARLDALVAGVRALVS